MTERWLENQEPKGHAKIATWRQQVGTLVESNSGLTQGKRGGWQWTVSMSHVEAFVWRMGGGGGAALW